MSKHPVVMFSQQLGGWVLKMKFTFSIPKSFERK